MAKGYPSMLALLGLVALAGYQNREKIAEMVGRLGDHDPQRPLQPGPDSTRGPLGGVGDLLKSGLGELVDRFKQSGRGDVAQSWVNRGPNQDIAPDDLRAAIGPEALASLSERTGLDEDELLSRLSQQLPSAVDRYTPEGRLPD
jgi:uncharacterized protein YidB (DUF937 family)